MRRENILLCSLYVGPAKPNMKLLLQPLTEQFEKLSGVGMLLKTPLGQSTFQAKLVVSVFDLPAKASVYVASNLMVSLVVAFVLILE